MEVVRRRGWTILNGNVKGDEEGEITQKEWDSDGD